MRTLASRAPANGTSMSGRACALSERASVRKMNRGPCYRVFAAAATDPEETRRILNNGHSSNTRQTCCSMIAPNTSRQAQQPLRNCLLRREGRRDRVAHLFGFDFARAGCPDVGRAHPLREHPPDCRLDALGLIGQVQRMAQHRFTCSRTKVRKNRIIDSNYSHIRSRCDLLT